MKRTILFSALATSLFAGTAMAQDDADKHYIRNSVYMLRLSEDSSNPDYAEAFKIMDATFDTINFAKNYERYNDFSLTDRIIKFSDLPTATQEEMDALGKDSKTQEIINKALKEQGFKESLSEYEYAARLLNYFKEKKYAQKLVAKWYNKPGTAIGECDFDNDLTTIFELGMKGLSQEALDNAKATGNLISTAKGSTNKLLSNTYVCVNRYGYMDAKEVIAISGALLQATLGNNAMAQIALKKGLEVMEQKIKGYFVRANAYLFKLDWNKELQDKLELEYWEKPSELMNDDNYKLVYVGKASKRAPAALSMKSSTSLDKLIARGTVRATDAAFSALQRENEEFRPMTSLHVIDGKLAAYIGLKEGIKNGDKFNVYAAVQSKEDPNLTEWKQVGNIKVEKGSVWDNRAGAGEAIEGAATDKEDEGGEGGKLPYTVFSGKPGKLGEGNMIRLAK